MSSAREREVKEVVPDSDSIVSPRKGSHFLENWQDKGKKLVKPPDSVKNGTRRAGGMTRESECCLLFPGPGSIPSSQPSVTPVPVIHCLLLVSKGKTHAHGTQK